MTIRRLAPEERILTRPLYEEVFPEDSQSFVDYYYTEKTADNEIYVVEEDGGIRSMLQLNPYLLMINGQAVQPTISWRWALRKLTAVGAI